MPLVSFESPFYLLLFLLLPLFWWLSQKRSLAHLPGARRTLALALRLTIASCLILALAGVHLVKQSGANCVLFVIDSSYSVPRRERQKALDWVNQATRNMRGQDKVGVLTVGGDGTYKVLLPPEKLFVDRNLYHHCLFERDKLYTLVYQTNAATYLKRFTFGGTILNKEYRCVPPKAKVLLLTDEVLERVYIKYKPLKPGKRGGLGKDGQQPDEQIVELAEIPVQPPKSLGTLLSHKAVDWLKTTRPRGWNENGSTPIGPLFN